MRSPGGRAAARIVVASDPEDLARRAADQVCGLLAAAIAERGIAHFVLTGGSSPLRLYAELRREPWRSSVEWSRVVLWMGDDRYVPSDDADSNAGVARRLLLDPDASPNGPLPVPPDNVRFFPIDAARSRADGAEWAAHEYGAQISAAVPGDPPIFDLILLGLGPDGHMLSVFPGSAALESATPLVLTIPAPTHAEPHLPRLTLNPRVVPAARAVMLLCQGGAKAGIVAAVLTEPRDPRRFPAQLAAGPNATWLLDAAAASRLADRHTLHP